MNYTIVCPQCKVERIVDRKTRQDRLCRVCSAKARPVKHGQYKTRLFKIWNSAKKRTNGSLNSVARRYTERNIKMCDEWRSDFMVFKEWSDNNGYGEDLTLDRIDTNGNYEPNNCRWTTKQIQSENTILIHKTNTSGYRGVSKGYIKKDGTQMWKSRIKRFGKEVSLGTYDCKIEAAKAYDKYVVENELEQPLNFER